MYPELTRGALLEFNLFNAQEFSQYDCSSKKNHRNGLKTVSNISKFASYASLLILDSCSFSSVISFTYV